MLDTLNLNFPYNNVENEKKKSVFTFCYLFELM